MKIGSLNGAIAFKGLNQNGMSSSISYLSLEAWRMPQIAKRRLSADFD